MKQTSTSNELLPLLEELRAQLATLSERMDRLERNVAPQASSAAAHPSAAPAPPPQAEPAATPAEEEGIPEETILAISAAVAAFLGVRARIRQIRLITSPAWAQQGRVSIQASHRLH